MTLHSRDIEEGFAELEFLLTLFYTVPPAPSKGSPVVFNITAGVKLMSSLTKGLAANPVSMKENLKKIRVTAMMYMLLPLQKHSLLGLF